MPRNFFDDFFMVLRGQGVGSSPVKLLILRSPGAGSATRPGAMGAGEFSLMNKFLRLEGSAMAQDSR
jgi:hypothetical protein